MATQKVTSETGKDIMWNLTAHMAPFLDDQQLLRLLNFQLDFVDNCIFDRQKLELQRIEILKTMNMVDYTWDLECQHRRLPEDTRLPEEYQQKKEQVMMMVAESESKVEEIRAKIRGASELFNQGRDNDRQWIVLKEEHGFIESDLDILFEHAKMEYSTGNYLECEHILYLYTVCAPSGHYRYLSALWGKAAAETLQIDDEDEKESDEKFTAASETLDSLKDCIEKMKSSRHSPLILLQWRAWLLHWSLFRYFSEAARRNQTTYDANIDHFINLFISSDKLDFKNGEKTNEYKNTIETICPWLLRYIAVVIVTSKNLDKKQKRLNEVIKLINQEHYNYTDPILDFLRCLNVKFDFESAQAHLVQSKQVLQTDYFLHTYADDFIEQGRILIFEMFCKIHQKIRVETIAEKLNMTQEDAELWIVELIRNAGLAAKIDSENGNIIMGSEPTLPYQEIIQKTSHLAITTQMLVKNLEKKVKPSQPNERPSWAFNRQSTGSYSGGDNKSRNFRGE